MVTLHGMGMMFLFMIPVLPAALGGFLAPLQLGADNLAFPRLNRTGFYFWAAGALFTLAAAAVGATGGWAFSAPFVFNTSAAVLLSAASIFCLCITYFITGLNLVVTIQTLRPGAMNWERLPVFCWSLYVSGMGQILAAPLLGLGAVAVIMEQFLNLGLFDPLMGGDPLLFRHFFWYFAFTAGMSVIVPCLGIAAEILTVFSRKTLYGRKTYILSLFLATGFSLLAGGVMTVSGQSITASALSGLAFLVAGIPLFNCLFSLAATLYKGTIDLSIPMVYILMFLFLFPAALLTWGIMGILPLNVYLQGTQFITGGLHLLMGAALIALLGGLHFWWPKITGKKYSEGWALIAAMLIFIGINLAFLPQLFAGAHGFPQRYYGLTPESRLAFQTLWSGALTAGCGLLIMLGNFFFALKKGTPSETNPWKAQTLEWLAPSPPPEKNFNAPPDSVPHPYVFEAEKVTV
jgi:cytochrome c oxidase subunit 1